MKSKPLFTGIAGGIKSTDNIQVQNLIGKSGLNTGNFLFVRALREILGTIDDVFRDQSYYLKQANEFDYIAISAANWVAPDTDLTKLCEIIESTELPCIVVGLGGQVAHGAKAPKLKDGTRRFIEVVSERSKFISVRGEHTQELLNDYGIKNTWNTGCPSVLGDGKGIRPVVKDESELNLSRLILQGTRHGYAGKTFEKNEYNNFNLDIYRYAYKNKISLLIQSEVPDIYWVMNRSNNLEIEEKNTVFLAKLYEDNPEDIKEYLLEQGLLFWNVDDWLQALMKYQYLLGTRIHGVISAVLAGIPATLIAHDERTSELAKRMNLPSIDLRNIDEFNEKTIIDSYNKCNFDRFNEKRAEYYLNFKDFFDQNEVSNTLKGWHEK